MGWNYTNKGISQLGSVGVAVIALGVLMLVFGVWHYNWNRELVEFGANPVPAARYRELALPAAFGLAVLIGGVMVMQMARRRGRDG